MTALCSGGTSQSKPGFNDSVYFTAPSIEGILTELGLAPLAVLLAPIIAVETYDLTTFCGTDPPADPVLVPSDLIDIYNYADPTIMLAAWLKIRNWFKSWYWCYVCECTNGVIPSCGPPSNPGPVTANPGLPSGSVSPACWDASHTYISQIPMTSLNDHEINATEILPGDAVATVTPTFGDSFNTAHVIPSGVEKITITCDGSGTYPGPAVAWVTYDSAGVGTAQAFPGDFTNAPTGLHQSHTYNFPAGAVSWQIKIFGYWTSPTGVHQGSNWDVTIDFAYTCTGANSPNTPCCPPDPLLEARLNSILALVQSIYAGLPAPLTSLAENTVHSALSGSSSFAIGSNTIGLKIELTTIPNRLGRAVEDPTFYFDAGWVTSSAAEGNYRSTRIVHTPQLVLLEPLVDTVHYTIPADVVVKITELTRGP